MKIRKATNRDIDFMMKFIKSETDYHYKIDKYYKPFIKYKGLKKYANFLLKDKNTKIIIIEEKEKIIGRMVGRIVSAPPYISPKKIGVIESAFIEKKYRHKKIGNKLFHELIKWFKKKKIKHIEVNVDARNKIGVGAWKKFGFSDYRLKLRLDL